MFADVNKPTLNHQVLLDSHVSMVSVYTFGQLSALNQWQMVRDAVSPNKSELIQTNVISLKSFLASFFSFSTHLADLWKSRSPGSKVSSDSKGTEVKRKHVVVQSNSSLEDVSILEKPHELKHEQKNSSDEISANKD